MSAGGMVEHVLRGPKSMSESPYNDVARDLRVHIGDDIYRIPIDHVEAKELAEALRLSDEELSAAVQSQAARGRLLVPSDMNAVNGANGR